MRLNLTHMKTIRITTQLTEQLANFVDTYAKKKRYSKRTVIENALQEYFLRVQRDELLTGFNAMGKDQTEMNEWLLIANNPVNL